MPLIRSITWKAPKAKLTTWRPQQIWFSNLVLPCAFRPFLQNGPTTYGSRNSVRRLACPKFCSSKRLNANISRKLLRPCCTVVGGCWRQRSRAPVRMKVSCSYEHLGSFRCTFTYIRIQPRVLDACCNPLLEVHPVRISKPVRPNATILGRFLWLSSEISFLLHSSSYLLKEFYRRTLLFVPCS